MWYEIFNRRIDSRLEQEQPLAENPGTVHRGTVPLPFTVALHSLWQDISDPLIR